MNARPDAVAEGAAKKRVIAVVGANAPGRGLVSAIREDPRADFAARAVLDDADLRTADGRSLTELGAELRKGQALDAASLRPAFAGAYGAFYIQLSSGHASLETKQATALAVASAAKDARLHHVIWATLTDPGQALLEHDDLTPTFVAGRWISDEKQHESVEEVFARFGVPATFLQISWDPSVAAGSWTEDIGRYAYTLLRSVEAIGKTVAVSAARLIRGVPPGLPAEAPVAVAPPLPVPLPPPGPALSPPSPLQPAAPGARSRAHRIGIASALVAGGLVGLLIARQVGRQILGPVPAHSDRTTAATPAAPAAATPAPDPEPIPTPAPAEAPAVVAPREVPSAPAAAAAVPAAVAAAPEPTPSAHGGTRHPAQLRQRHADPHRPLAGVPAAPAAPVAAAAPATTIEKPVPAPAAAAPEAPRAAAVPPPPAAKPAPAVASTAAPPPAAAPATAVGTQAAAPRPGYVDPKAVSAAVRAHAAEARACYDRAIMEHPDLHGRLTLRATLDPAGHVLSLTPSSDIAEGGRLQSCLIAAFKSWSFPAPAGGVNGNISYAFAFDSEIAR